MTHSSIAQICLRGLLLAIPLGSLGCGRATEVTGKATLNGRPIASGSVIILAADSMTYSGNLDDKGVYRILNVPRGNAKVSIASPNAAAFTAQDVKVAGKFPDKRLIKAAAAPATAPPSWFPIPPQFGDFEKSELRLEVQRGVNTFDISLVGEPPKK